MADEKPAQNPLSIGCTVVLAIAMAVGVIAFCTSVGSSDGSPSLACDRAHIRVVVQRAIKNHLAAPRSFRYRSMYMSDEFPREVGMEYSAQNAYGGTTIYAALAVVDRGCSVTDLVMWEREA